MFPATGGAPMTPSPQNVLETARFTRSNSIFIIPAFIHAWSTIPQALEYMKELEFVAYAGAPLLPKIGNELAKVGVRLNAIYGSTEAGSPCHLVPEKGSNEWEYLRFYPHTKLRWIPQGDNTFDYENVDSIVVEQSSTKLTWDTIDLTGWILEQATELTGGKCTSIELDLFEQGFDSLSATILRLRIANAMRSSGKPMCQKASRDLPQDLIYNEPTIKRLSASLASFAGLGPLPLPQTPYTSMTEQSAIVVLLTGSTGHLGSQILAEILMDDRISTVYAFNRANTSAATLIGRHVERFKDIGIDEALLNDEKLVLITGNPVRSDLGIKPELYAKASLPVTSLMFQHTNELVYQISSSVDVVIHNAWQLDFNLTLSSYEPNIQNSRYLIDLVRLSQKAPHVRFVFVSSIASAQAWGTSRRPVPENVVDPQQALGGGYGEAKYVVERMLLYSGLQATSLRVGQISGGRPNGSWPTTEWLPIVVKSSVALGIIPDMGGKHDSSSKLDFQVVSWLPADSVAATVLDVAMWRKHLPPVLNVVHPRPVDYNVPLNGIVKGIRELLGINLALVPYDQWLTTLEAQAEKATLNTLKCIVSAIHPTTNPDTDVKDSACNQIDRIPASERYGRLAETVFNGHDSDCQRKLTFGPA
ncbi:hypothetical protein H0H87_011868 [Tephrocybe sp. NHM501043]|nr:hypothetical protein H0H87_011868 [Tephrocybe sp. NHM501043]